MLLRHLDGHGFEDWCQVILERRFGCEVEATPRSGAQGIDLIVHTKNGPVYVECKHYPNGTVGREVIQKLDSAIRFREGNRGLVLTTGRFAPTAKEYAQSLPYLMELVDATKLATWAAKVGVSLKEAGFDARANGVASTHQDRFQYVFLKSVCSRERFRPLRGKYPKANATRRTRYAPFFIGRFQANGRVDTAVGRQEASWGGEVWMDARGGRCGLDAAAPILVSGMPVVPLSDALDAAPGEAPDPRFGHVEAKRRIREFLSGELEESVTYRGRNNQTYTKTIQPSRSQVHVDGLRLVYVPHQDFTLTLEQVTHQGKVEDWPKELRVHSGSLGTCSVCQKRLRADTQVLCAECHRPAHRHRILHPHSYACSTCEATLCRIHARRTDSRTYCGACAPSQAKPFGSDWVVPSWIAGLGVAAAATIESALTGSQATWTFLIGAASTAPAFMKVSTGNDRGETEPVRYPKEGSL